MFNSKTILITGGTGSFGNAALERFLKAGAGEIRIFSRDEKKQYDMRKEYSSNQIKFYIGDVRSERSIRDAMHGVDYVFHAAALKQVPSCEFFPMEAIKTNVIGTENVLNAAISQGVKKVVCLSSDKAAYPVNAMGMSKAMMEKVAVAKTRTASVNKTLICITRYGNVMCSRGSVIPLFVEQIKSNMPITVTNASMTRFMMTLDEAIDLVLFAFVNGEAGDIFVQKSSACTIGDLAQALKELFNADNEVRHIGIRHGEKIYETLLTNEEYAHADDMGSFYRVPMDKRGLNYDSYFVQGDISINKTADYNSSNTELLNIEQIKSKLLSLKYIQEEIKNRR
jgi:UDP-glucose 4-epimerase